MARVHEEDGFQVHIWPNDHPPAHVHIYRAEGLIIVDLLTFCVRAAYDVGPRDIRQALEIAEANADSFLARWREIHGR